MLITHEDILQRIESYLREHRGIGTAALHDILLGTNSYLQVKGKIPKSAHRDMMMVLHDQVGISLYPEYRGKRIFENGRLYMPVPRPVAASVACRVLPERPINVLAEDLSRLTGLDVAPILGPEPSLTYEIRATGPRVYDPSGLFHIQASSGRSSRQAEDRLLCSSTMNSTSIASFWNCGDGCGMLQDLLEMVRKHLDAAGFADNNVELHWGGDCFSLHLEEAQISYFPQVANEEKLDCPWLVEIVTETPGEVSRHATFTEAVQGTMFLIFRTRYHARLDDQASVNFTEELKEDGLHPGR